MTERDRPERPDQVRVARTDLAERLGVDVDEVVVVSVEEVTWRDASLGCPQPGMFYPQVLVDGTRIVLRAGDRSFEYHTGGRRGPFLCEDPQPPVGEE